MANVLRVQIEDHRNGEDDVWQHDLPMTTSMGDIGKAIETLYPTAASFSVFVHDPDEDKVEE